VISVVTFKWEKPGYRSVFTSNNVNITYNMAERNYPEPFRFICVTDNPEGLDPRIEVIPLWDDFANVRNPTWVNGPSCYRRLKVFSRWFAEKAGEKFVVLDLDAVITGDLRPLWDRDEDFLIWRPGHQRIPLCGSMFMLRAGAHQEIWDKFDHMISPRLSNAAGFRGSDQAWITYCLGRDTPGWTTADGVYGFKDHLCKGLRNRPNIVLPRNLKPKHPPGPEYGALPADARIVMFTGRPDPWDREAQMLAPWIKEHYR
jgi:hypothetical protein